MLRHHVDRRILVGFGIASAFGGLIGALLGTRFSSRGLAVVFGALLIVAGMSEFTGWMRRVRWGRRAAWVAGAISGALGGLVGNQGGIRTAAMLGFDVPKESFVAGDRCTVAARARGRRRVVIGTAFGTRILGWVPERIFRRVIAVLLTALGVSMMATGGM